MPDFDLKLDDVRNVFSEFEKITALPAGGQKLVFLATNKNNDNCVLKIIKQDNGMKDQRTFREINAASKMLASCFSKIFNVKRVQIDFSDYIAIFEEYIDGKTLSEILENQKSLPLLMVKKVGLTLLTALTFIEKANLVHRDIKPGNIIIGNDNRIVLIDFGIARHLDEKSVTLSCAFFGPMTLGYCAPEQIRNDKRQISIRTDFFAIGIVLYEITTGKNPFRDGCKSPQEVIDRCLNLDPPPLSTLGYPKKLSDFVQTCMAKACHRRIASSQKALEYFQTIDWKANYEIF